VDPRADLDDVEKRKYLTLPGLELRFLGRPAIMTALYRPPNSKGCVGIYEIYIHHTFRLYFSTQINISDFRHLLRAGPSRCRGRSMGWNILDRNAASGANYVLTDTGNRGY
jgi:hypothetical protein